MSKHSLVGWRRVVVEGGVMLLPPDPGQGLIRVQAREPLRPARAVIADYARGGLGGRPVEVVAAPRLIATDEGEHAVLVTLGASGEGRELRRHLGIVFGDEHVAVIDGRVGAAEQLYAFAELVERITRSWCLGLGVERWRRFYYAPPRSWSALARPRADLWLAPGFPRNPGMISVFHARPQRPSGPAAQHSRLFEGLTSEYVPLGPSDSNPVRARSGLLGEAALFEASFDGRVVQAANVGFSDGRYLYLLRVETDREHRDPNTTTFRELIDSVEPLPRPAHDLGVLVHWSE